MNQNIDSYVSKIKGAGLRMTEQRKAILGMLMDTKKPVTVLEAHDTLNKNKRKKVADLASLYRTFEAFEDLEIIHQMGHNSYVLCQHIACNSSKYHVLLNCNSCNSFTEMHLPTENIEAFASYLKRSKKFQIDKHPLTLSGICADCK